MLVLSRRKNDKILIGNDIVVTVVKVQGQVIRLGIEAPRDVRVIRSELQFKIDEDLTAGVAHGNDESNDDTSEGSVDEPGPRMGSTHNTQPRLRGPLAGRSERLLLTCLG